jgi:hypothetical protein
LQHVVWQQLLVQQVEPQLLELLSQHGAAAFWQGTILVRVTVSS